MKSNTLAVLFGLLVLFAPSAAQTFYGTEDVAVFREGRDKEFRNRSESPLLNSDFYVFGGLSYFDVDEKYRVKAIFEGERDESYFLMPTTSGTAVNYKKVGKLEFDLEGKRLTLYAYQSERILTNESWHKKYGHAFFIPFKDLTNGKTSYGGGRYIYMKIPESRETILDFNLAFNPSCAYGKDQYSCPIPPRSNRLEVEIRAGEKVFEYTKEKK